MKGCLFPSNAEANRITNEHVRPIAIRTAKQEGLGSGRGIKAIDAATVERKLRYPGLVDFKGQIVCFMIIVDESTVAFRLYRYVNVDSSLVHWKQESGVAKAVPRRDDVKRISMESMFTRAMGQDEVGEDGFAKRAHSPEGEID